MKYKLIKEYPGSLKLGEIIENNNTLKGHYYNIKNNNHIGIVEPYKYPEFWEKIEEISVGTKVVDTYPETEGYIYEKQSTGLWKLFNCSGFTISEDSIGEGKRFQIVKEEVKKEYEILSFIVNRDYNLLNKGDIVTKLLNGNFKKEGICEDSENYILTLPWWSINSVKYLKTGEIFTIGDRVDFTTSKNQVITEFRLLGNHISVYSNSSQEGLPSISKIKTPLFVTEDNVNIFEGDEFYFIAQSNWKIGSLKANKGVTAECSHGRFKLIDKAQEFILLNKPVLSIRDLEKIDLYPNGSNRIQIDKCKLKELVKSKL